MSEEKRMNKKKKQKNQVHFWACLFECDALLQRENSKNSFNFKGIQYEEKLTINVTCLNKEFHTSHNRICGTFPIDVNKNLA